MYVCMYVCIYVCTKTNKNTGLPKKDETVRRPTKPCNAKVKLSLLS